MDWQQIIDNDELQICPPQDAAMHGIFYPNTIAKLKHQPKVGVLAVFEFEPNSKYLGKWRLGGWVSTTSPRKSSQGGSSLASYQCPEAAVLSAASSFCVRSSDPLRHSRSGLAMRARQICRLADLIRGPSRNLFHCWRLTSKYAPRRSRVKAICQLRTP